MIYFFIIMIVLAFVGVFAWLVADQERSENAAPPEPFDFSRVAEGHWVSLRAEYESARAEWAKERGDARKETERT